MNLYEKRERFLFLRARNHIYIDIVKNILGHRFGDVTSINRENVYMEKQLRSENRVLYGEQSVIERSTIKAVPV